MIASDDEALVRMLHYATEMPLALYRDGVRTLSYPAAPPSASAILGGADPLASIQISENQPGNPQYVSNQYEERFIYCALDSCRALLLGAFLPGSVGRNAIYQMLRVQHLPVSMFETLEAHYRSLPQVAETRHFYLGRLLSLVCAIPSPAAGLHASSDVGIGPVVFQNTYENRMQQFSHPPYFLEQELVRHITHGDRRNAVRILSEINALSRATLSRDPLRSVRNSLIASVTLFTRAAIAGGAFAEAAFTLSDSYIQTLEDIHDLRALESLEESMVLRFIDLVQSHTARPLSNITRTAIRYIDDHLTDRLTLDSIAEACYVHPVYLSKRFKQDTGEVISGFIQQRRIEEARHFIRHTNSPISEIASFYQFCSQSHFIQVFKRHAGMTPAEFRISGA